MELTERHVQAVWYDAALRPERLYTTHGNAVKVVYPGDWNLEAGPDFKNAVLEVGSTRRRVFGDVEVHLCPADWDLHRHGSDPAYRNVVAHVTWRCGPPPASLPDGAISIWLGKFAAADPRFSVEAIDVDAYPYSQEPVKSPLVTAESDYAEKLKAIADAGKSRLRMKARRLSGRLGSAGGDCRQVFYEEVMMALGYRNNSAQFRRLAEMVPIKALPKEYAAALNAMSVVADFLEWNRRRGRPNNDPKRRLECAARLFTETDIMKLMLADDFSRKGCRRMVGMLCEGQLMGKGRAATIITNVIAPWAIAEGRLADTPDWLPAEEVSGSMRVMAHRLLGRDHNPAGYCGNGVMMQGLLRTCEVARNLV